MADFRKIEALAAERTEWIKKNVQRVFQRYFNRSEGLEFTLDSTNTAMGSARGINVKYPCSLPAPTDADPNAVDVVRGELLYVVMLTKEGNVMRDVKYVVVHEMSPVLVAALRGPPADWEPDREIYAFFRHVHRMLALPKEVATLVESAPVVLHFEKRAKATAVATAVPAHAVPVDPPVGTAPALTPSAEFQYYEHP